MPEGDSDYSSEGSGSYEWNSGQWSQSVNRNQSSTGGTGEAEGPLSITQEEEEDEDYESNTKIIKEYLKIDLENLHDVAVKIDKIKRMRLKMESKREKSSSKARKANK